MKIHLIGLLLGMAGWVLPVGAEPDLVVIVRHAEKAASPVGDPGLSEVGQARAVALADALGDAGITAIVTTQYRRTRATAQVLADRIGVVPLAIDARRGEAQAHIDEVVAALRALDGRVLVVGHSNTVAHIVAGLGGPAMPDLCDSSYGRAFVLVPQPDAPGVVRMRYGAPDPDPDAGCQ